MGMCVCVCVVAVIVVVVGTCQERCKLLEMPPQPFALSTPYRSLRARTCDAIFITRCTVTSAIRTFVCAADSADEAGPQVDLLHVREVHLVRGPVCRDLKLHRVALNRILYAWMCACACACACVERCAHGWRTVCVWTVCGTLHSIRTTPPPTTTTTTHTYLAPPTEIDPRMLPITRAMAHLAYYRGVEVGGRETAELEKLFGG